MRDYNFFSPYIETKKNPDKKSVHFAVIAIILVVSAIGYYAFNMFQINIMQKELLQIEDFLKSEQTQNSLLLYEDTQAKVKILNDYKVIIEDVNNRIYINDRINGRLMDDIRLAMPKNTFIRVMNITETSLQLQGIAKDRTSIAEYTYNLKQLKAFEGVHIGNINQESDDGSSYVFTIICKMGVVDSNEVK